MIKKNSVGDIFIDEPKNRISNGSRHTSRESNSQPGSVRITKISCPGHRDKVANWTSLTGIRSHVCPSSAIRNEG